MYKTSARWMLLGCLLTGLLTTSCLTNRLSNGATAYVYVAANGVITFWGEPVTLDKLTQKLKMAGANRGTLIKIVPQGEVTMRLLQSIAGHIGRKGLPRVVIMETRKAVTVIDGRIVDEVRADDTPKLPVHKDR